MITCRRDDFHLPDDLHYLNCAYMAPLSKAVERAGIAGLLKKRDPSSIRAEDFFEESEQVRELFARILGASPRSVAIIPSVSYGVASIAQNLRVEAGDNIVVLEEQFPSNIYIWQRIAERENAQIRTVMAGSTSAARAAKWNERILEAIDARTSVVALPHVHWTDGTLFDLPGIAERARSVEAALVVDGTQSVGALPFDVEQIQPDALICAGYKWLFGPYSIGMAYFSERYHSGRPLEENWIARNHSEQFSRLVQYEGEYQPGAVRYDVGERSNFILIPMMAAALDQVLDWGAEDIQAYCRQLTADPIAEIRELGYGVEDSSGRAQHLFGIRMPRAVDPEDLRTALEQRNISVSVRGSAVRVSPHVYNDEQDVDALIDALRAAVSISPSAS